MVDIILKKDVHYSEHISLVFQVLKLIIMKWFRYDIIIFIFRDHMIYASSWTASSLKEDRMIVNMILKKDVYYSEHISQAFRDGKFIIMKWFRYDINNLIFRNDMIDDWRWSALSLKEGRIIVDIILKKKTYIIRSLFL